ncbi:GrpB family protein [Paenibacillus aurantius]|uniref:GrpB family protein n=1 Tax=Paenibacillus aurantius TaxID=2918900 RepID=A0AA96LBJ6_9BACL|nr:GrpB family protein [Paenibacillus aurantius]WNQ10114.1 GrpB family protein [Paenibacillus aurantius]
MPDDQPYPVTVVPYRNEWPREYEKERVRLINLPLPHLVTIEHGGSTSIPGLAAKPIIDLFAALLPFGEEALYRDLLASLGYRPVSTGMANRHLFRRTSQGAPSHHLHLLPFEGFYERNELLFRDFLLAHPEWVPEYAEVKRRLAAEFPDDPEAYTLAKTAFIQEVVDRARTERGLRISKVWEPAKPSGASPDSDSPSSSSDSEEPTG